MLWRCTFHSQSETFLLLEDWGIPFGEKATRGHLGVYRPLWWKKNYPQTKTGRKRSITLICNRYAYSSHFLNLSFYYAVLKLRHGQILEMTFRSTLSLWGNRKDHQINTGEKLSEKPLCDVCVPPGSYTSLLLRQCLNTVPVKLKTGYFAALWRIWQKVKYPGIKHRNQRSKKLPSGVCIHFRELTLTLRCPVWKLCPWLICEGILSGAQIVTVRKETPYNENWRDAFGEPGFWCGYPSHRVKSFFLLSSLKSLFLRKLRKDIWEDS